MDMENEIVIFSDSSSDSIQEIEPPRKSPPVIIDIEADELITNMSKCRTQILTENFFKNEEIPEASSGDNPSHWTEDMKKFYNDDWGDEKNFTVEKIQEEMDKRPSLWKVSRKDLLAKNKKRKNVKCWNCCQYGHNMYKCREPLHVPKCHMCGVAGHLSNRCPNAICLNCGNKTQSFVTNCGKCSKESYVQCSRCSLIGHHFINCSDNWRMYHSTIGKVEIDVPTQSVHKAESELWCCNCGKKGHYQVHCQEKKQLAFPETFPFVASYENSFNPQTVNLTLPEPEIQILPIKKNCNQRKKKNQFHMNSVNLFSSNKSLNKLNQVKKPKKKRKKKKDRIKNKSAFFQTLDFIPL